MNTKTTRTLLTLSVLAMLLPFAAFAQTSPDDPAVQAAKEKTAVVFDLGRMFGYLQTLENDFPKIALSASQLNEVYGIMTTIKATKRMDPSLAEELLLRIEDKVLTPAQLTQVDQIAIAKMNERETSSTNQSGSGGGQITSYIAGGPFNPMTDATKTIGKDFEAYFQYLSKKLGK
jgi:hypothetical protein